MNCTHGPICKGGKSRVFVDLLHGRNIGLLALSMFSTFSKYVIIHHFPARFKLAGSNDYFMGKNFQGHFLNSGVWDWLSSKQD